MKFLLKSVLLVVFFLAVSWNLIISQNLGFDWIKVHESYSGSNPYVYIYDVQSDNNNNVYVTGYFSSHVIFDSDTLHSIDNSDIFLTKYNPSGEIQWIKHFGGSNEDGSYSIAINSDNDIYINGHFKEECNFDGIILTTSNFREQYIAKINESGVTQWAKSFETDALYTKILIDDTGNLFYTGSLDDEIIFGNDTLFADGYLDLFIAKLNQNGDYINGVVVNGFNAVYAKDMKYNDGNLYLIGHFKDYMEFPGVPLNSNGREDIFIAKYNTDLQLQWANQAGGFYEDHGESIIIRENDFVVSGNFSGNCYFDETEFITSTGVLDAFVASYDFSGNFNWVNSIGGSANEYNNKVLSDTSEILYLTGSSRGKIEKEGYSYEPFSFESDIYLARFSPNGHFHWLTGFKGIGHEFPRAFRRNMNNSFMLIGSLEDGIYFTDTIAQGTTGNDKNIFVTVFNDTVYQNDIAVSYMSEPSPVNIFEANKQVTVKVDNLGSNPQSNISVLYSVNNNTPVVNIIPAFDSYESIYHTFTQTVDMTEIGKYIFEFEVELIGDENPENNILIDTAISIAVPTTALHWGSTGDPLNGLTVSWTNRHDSNETDSIRWGYTDEYSEGMYIPSKLNLWNRDLFSYQFPPLIEDTVIHYSFYNNFWDQWSANKTYSTSVNIDSDSFSFSVTGNTQTNTDDWKIVADIMGDESDFGLFLGDIASGSYEWGDVWEEWMIQGEHFTADNLIYHAYGDNDYDSGYETYEDILFLPESSSGSKRYYSFEYDNAVFICLNSNNEYYEQQDWLENTLEANSDKIWKFVYFHHLFYSCGGHENEIDYLFDTWWQTFDDHGVDMILTGQAHNYQRTKPINRNVDNENPVEEYGSNPEQGRCQINLGGAGAEIEDVILNDWFETAEAVLHFGKFEIDDNRLFFSAIDTSGQLIDRFVHIKYYPGEIIANEDSICFGSSTGNMSLVNYKGTITKWQKRFNGGTWTDIDNTAETYEEIPESAGLWGYRTELIDFDSTLYSEPIQINVSDEPVSNFSNTQNNMEVTFMNLSENAVSYLWDFGDGNFSTEESPVHVYSSPNIYNVQLMAMNHICLNDTFASNVIIYLPGEIISDEDYVCIGSSTGNMSLVNYKGTITKWQKRFNGGTWTDIDNTAETYEEIPESAGLWGYRTELIDFDSTLYSEPIQINVSDEPVSNFSNTQNNMEVTFMNLSENAVSYLWDFGDGNSSTEDSPVHVYSFPNIYNVQLIAMNYICLNDTFDSNVSIPKGVAQIVSVYPNPTSGIIHIYLNEIQDDMFVRIYDLTGKLLIEKYYNRIYKTNLSLENLERGSYMLELSSDNIYINKFIIFM